MLPAALRLLATLVAQALAVGGLHVLGRAPWAGVPWSQLGTWLAMTPPEVAIAAVLRLAATGLAWWLLAATLLHVAARASDSARALAVTGAITPPTVRRLVDRAVAASLVVATGVPTTAARAEQPPPEPVLATAAVAEPFVPPALSRWGAADPPGRPAAEAPSPRDMVDPPAAPAQASPRESARPPVPPAPRSSPDPAARPDRRPAPPTPDPAARPDHRPALPAPDPAASANASRRTSSDLAAQAGRTRVVRPGEHLWRIAAEEVATHEGVAIEAVAPDHIAHYWRGLVAVNRHSVPSGDLDLLYPGDQIVLPPQR